MKTKVIIFILLFSIINVSAEDSIYIVSGDKMIKQGEYTIVAQDNITSDILIDSNQLYFFTKNHEYIVNSSSGEIKYKIKVSGITEQKQTDNYIYLKTLKSVYNIRKDNGTIKTQTKYISSLNNIYSLFGFSTSPANGINGTNGTNGINGTNGTNGINGTNGTNGTNGINQSDPLKLNLTGGNMTGKLKFDLIDGAISDETSQNRFIEFSHNNSIRTYINRLGSQLWYLNNSGVSKGLIAYVTPNDLPGITFLNSTFSGNSRRDLRGGVMGLEIVVYSNNSLNTSIFTTDGSLQINKLSGSGNAYACIDSTGKLYRGSPTC